LKFRFDEDLYYSEERDLYLKLFLMEKPNYQPIEYVLFYYRKHQNSNTIGRYKTNIQKISIIKSRGNLYDFIEEHSLWDIFLIKEMLKFYLFDNFDKNNTFSIVKNSRNFLNLYVFLILKFKVKIYILFRKIFRKIISKNLL
jgi:hypothetical protein